MHAAAHARRSTHWSQWQANTGPPTPRSSPDWPEPPCWASPTPCESADPCRQPPGRQEGCADPPRHRTGRTCPFPPPVGMRATETAVRSDPDERMPQRGAYGVGLDTCCMIEVDPERFEVMVSEALDGIPAELGELMSNVAVTVQHDSGPAGLLGLYQGVPLTRRSTFYAGALPDRITIYRRAICAVCNSDSEVVEQVRRTVIHEVGHHFGIGDARLRELGW